MPTIHLVIAEHFHVPGIRHRACATSAIANSEAASMVNLMLDDTEADEKPERVTADNWSDAAEWLEDFHGAAHCYVEIIELPLQEKEG